jgi:hypothetical protein
MFTQVSQRDANEMLVRYPYAIWPALHADEQRGGVFRYRPFSGNGYGPTLTSSVVTKNESSFFCPRSFANQRVSKGGEIMDHSRETCCVR